MAELIVYGINEDPVFVPAADTGDTFRNSQATELIVWNDTAGSVVLTVTAKSRCNFKFLDHQTHTIPAQTLTAIRPFKSQRFNDANGLVHISFDDHTNIQVSARRLLQA